MFIFQKKRQKYKKNKEKYFLFWERARQGLTLLLRISSRVENQGYAVLWIRLFIRLIFYLWHFC